MRCCMSQERFEILYAELLTSHSSQEIFAAADPSAYLDAGLSPDELAELRLIAEQIYEESHHFISKRAGFLWMPLPFTRIILGQKADSLVHEYMETFPRASDQEYVNDHRRFHLFLGQQLCDESALIQDILTLERSVFITDRIMYPEESMEHINNGRSMKAPRIVVTMDCLLAPRPGVVRFHAQHDLRPLVTADSESIDREALQQLSQKNFSFITVRVPFQSRCSLLSVSPNVLETLPLFDGRRTIGEVAELFAISEKIHRHKSMERIVEFAHIFLKQRVLQHIAPC